MQVAGQVAFVTGAGRGIGRAVCREFMRRGAAAVIVADLDGDQAVATASELSGFGLQCDVADEASVRRAIAATEKRYGRIDVLLSNAGFGTKVLDLDDPLSTPNETGTRMREGHVMAHVYAGRAALP